MNIISRPVAMSPEEWKYVWHTPAPVSITGTWPNGMLVRKVSVPFGVIGVIFEARPNVVFDVFALCFKAGSACVLKVKEIGMDKGLRAAPPCQGAGICCTGSDASPRNHNAALRAALLPKASKWCWATANATA